METERTTLVIEAPTPVEVTAALHDPGQGSGLAVLLTPGAGGDLDGVGLTALAEVITAQGHLVVRCNLPHNEVGRPAPRAERSVGALTGLLGHVRERIAPDRGWIIGGKSYGGRVASMAVASGTQAIGLLLYGYPLHPPGKPDRLRVEHWPEVTAPTMFLQGSRDPFCDLDLLRANLGLLPNAARLKIVEGGDHSLDVAAGSSPDGVHHGAPDVLRDLGPVIADWIGSLDVSR